MKQLKNMDEDEFMSAWTKAAEDLEKAKEKTREFAEEHQRRESLAAAQRRLDGLDLSPEDMAALAQVAKTEGVESKESVHNG